MRLSLSFPPPGSSPFRGPTPEVMGTGRAAKRRDKKAGSLDFWERQDLLSLGVGSVDQSHQTLCKKSGTRHHDITHHTNTMLEAVLQPRHLCVLVKC